MVDERGEDLDRWLVTGPDRASNLLEVIVLVTAEGDEFDHPRHGPSGCPSEVARAIIKRTYGHTKSGTPIDDDLIEELAHEAEVGYDVGELIACRGKRGRPRLGSAPSTVESVRLDPELKERLTTNGRRRCWPSAQRSQTLV